MAKWRGGVKGKTKKMIERGGTKEIQRWPIVDGLFEREDRPYKGVFLNLLREKFNRVRGQTKCGARTDARRHCI